MVGTESQRRSVRLMVAVGAAIALVATMSPAVAQEEPLTSVIVDFPDPVGTDVTDLAGSLIGEGVHVGILRCYDIRCAQKTQLQLTETAVYEYKFKDLQAFDPLGQTVVVAGDGVISDGDGKQRFRFTATLENNGDGTVFVRYEASRPDASFIIPAAPGTFAVLQRP
jgi:hypothetical protein